ncbi:MAG: pirin family protein [Alphaproteobacteria bacterium]|nr:pirin family protein [Alphaproteobacteria bacterium]
MIALRPSEARGHLNFGWLDTHHSFSFGQYHDPAFMGFRSLRVINEDRIAGGAGFPTHPHRDMEIMTLVLDGALAHKDSMGNGATIRPDEVQVMSAGTGVQHSEFNADAAKPAHILQIWMLPDRAGITPRYDQQAYPRSERLNRLKLVLTPDPAGDEIKLNQDARIHLGALEAGAAVTHTVPEGRHVWVQVARGTGTANGEAFRDGDGIALSFETAVTIAAETDTDIVLFDMA